MLLEETMRAALRRDPMLPAIEYERRWYDWGWLSSISEHVDTTLAAAGLGPNMPIGLIARNRPNFVAALLSVIASGRSVVMIYAFQSAQALAGDVRRLNLPAIIGDIQDWGPAVREAAVETGTLGLALGGEAEQDVTVVVPANPDKAGNLRGPVDALAVEMLTSGTTGTPKRLPLSFDFVARALIGESTQAAAPATVDTPLDPALMMFPFGNISGLYSYIPMAASGRPVVLLEKFSTAAWVDFVRRYRPKQMNLPTAGVRMILEAKVPAEDLSSVEFIFSGASWLDPNVQAEFLQVYNIPILLSYGATEFGGVVTAMTPEMYKQYGVSKLDSVGRSWAGTEVRVVDDNGAEVAAGETGVLELRAPRLGSEWIRTTDFATIDADGFIFHRGRTDGAITRGGFKIIPEAVAEKIALHPAVAAAAVVGLPDARLGEVPVAAIELRAGAAQPSFAELDAHARKHLYATHIPVAYRFVDALPRTVSLKVSLPAVKALFAEAADALPK